MCTLCHRSYCHRCRLGCLSFNCFNTFVCGCGERHCVYQKVLAFYICIHFEHFYNMIEGRIKFEAQLLNPTLICCCCCYCYSLIPAFEYVLPYNIVVSRCHFSNSKHPTTGKRASENVQNMTTKNTLTYSQNTL